MARKPRPLAIALMGPTAAGKTDLAIELAKHLGSEIISVDSVLVYRGMDIGTAKPSAHQLAAVRHHLIDIRDPAEPYTVADFCRDVKREMLAVLSRGKTPLLVGGTMMYFNALLKGLSPLPESDPCVRKNIAADAQCHGWPYVHQQLADVDPAMAARIHPNHSQRISRALEVFLVSGKSMSQLLELPLDDGLLNQYNWLQLAIAPRERSLLHSRIEARFDAMLSAGLLDEVRRLVARPDISGDLPAIRAVGYRQAWQYLHNELSYEAMRAKSVVASRQLAKRQLTWLRGWQNLKWLYTQYIDGAIVAPSQLLDESLKLIESSES